MYLPLPFHGKEYEQWITDNESNLYVWQELQESERSEDPSDKDGLLEEEAS